MCIRDSPSAEGREPRLARDPRAPAGSVASARVCLFGLGASAARGAESVSYTHLTLPTICSV
eukprot:13247794-Alexandrium_andersonii.AAC.1